MAKKGGKRKLEVVYLVCEETGDYNYTLRRKSGQEKLKLVANLNPNQVSLRIRSLYETVAPEFLRGEHSVSDCRRQSRPLTGSDLFGAACERLCSLLFHFLDKP